MECVIDALPYTVQPVAFAMAGVSRAWSKCVCPINTASQRGTNFGARVGSMARGRLRATCPKDARLRKGSVTIVVPSKVMAKPAVPSHWSERPAGSASSLPRQLVEAAAEVSFRWRVPGASTNGRMSG